MEIAKHQSLIDNTLPAVDHPNYRLWSNYARFAGARGELVLKIISSRGNIAGKKILDLGCGEGGTAVTLAENNATVYAVDFKATRIHKLRDKLHESDLEMSTQVCKAQNLPFNSDFFDGVILQDVFEHLHDQSTALTEIHRVLKPDGFVYVSTPNRWSPLNFISDPHWNLPLVAILNKQAVAFFILKLVKRETKFRQDFAGLLSLRRIRKLFYAHGFSLRFANTKAAGELFNNPVSVVNSDFHIKLVNLLIKFRLDKLFKSLVNDRFGLFNYFINPTWYFVATKKVME